MRTARTENPPESEAARGTGPCVTRADRHAEQELVARPVTGQKTDSPTLRQAATTLNDRQAQFLITVADLCAAASLAALPVELVTRDGVRTGGVPGSLRRSAGAEQVDDSGYARTFRIDSRLVNLDEIVECTMRSPDVVAG